MVTQLRIYVINRGQMDAFVAAWLAGVYPLRRQHGFDTPDTWINWERNEFVWILSYDGPEPWGEKEADYYGSQQRVKMTPASTSRRPMSGLSTRSRCRAGWW